MEAAGIYSIAAVLVVGAFALSALPGLFRKLLAPSPLVNREAPRRRRAL